MALPYTERRKLLDGSSSWRARTGARRPTTRATARRCSSASRERGLEGVIAKRLDSAYEPGRRTGAWLKIKNVQRQEVVIGGWMPGEGRREDSIGSLAVGYYDGDKLRLRRRRPT